MSSTTAATHTWHGVARGGHRVDSDSIVCTASNKGRATCAINTTRLLHSVNTHNLRNAIEWSLQSVAFLLLLAVLTVDSLSIM